MRIRMLIQFARFHWNLTNDVCEAQQISKRWLSIFFFPFKYCVTIFSCIPIIWLEMFDENYLRQMFRQIFANWFCLHLPDERQLGEMWLPKNWRTYGTRKIGSFVIVNSRFLWMESKAYLQKVVEIGYYWLVEGGQPVLVGYMFVVIILIYS